jgi:hypothetical protein
MSIDIQTGLDCFMQRNCWIPLALAAALTIIGSGCASRTSGYKITNDTVAFIKPGVTSRAELVENLGPPLFEMKNPHVVAYTWGKVRPTASRSSANVEVMQPQDRLGYPTAPPSGEESGLIESRRWIYCVALDDQDRVQRSETVKLEGETSLGNAVRRWAVGSPAPAAAK